MFRAKHPGTWAMATPRSQLVACSKSDRVHWRSVPSLHTSSPLAEERREVSLAACQQQSPRHRRRPRAGPAARCGPGQETRTGGRRSPPRPRRRFAPRARPADAGDRPVAASAASPRPMTCSIALRTVRTTCWSPGLARRPPHRRHCPLRPWRRVPRVIDERIAQVCEQPVDRAQGRVADQCRGNAPPGTHR